MITWVIFQCQDKVKTVQENFESQKPYVQLKMFIYISSCFPFSLELTIPRDFHHEGFQNTTGRRSMNEQVLQGATEQICS